MTNAEIIWKYFENKKFNQYAIAGIMGNMKAESSLVPNNLQGSYNVKFNMSDEEYTTAVDNGTYTNFINDQAGYGLVQFTYSGYKKELYEYCKSKGKSIADITCQLDCVYSQISKNGVAAKLNACTSVRQASDIFLTKYECPKDQSESVQIKRAGYAQEYYDQFAKKSTGGGKGMKYNSNNKPMVCMMTNATCYKGTRKMQVKGVLWHSTGANNPWLKRYVQPDDDAPDKEKMLEILGKNPYRNDWNHDQIEAGLNAWIGKLADGTVTTVQVMPWDYRPWGCGGASKGSCNDGWIQFEICEDGLTDRNYFETTYKEACELTAYLCKMYGLNPKGKTNLNGVSVPVILCHADSFKLGLGSNHGDVYGWYNRYNRTMDDVRNDVASLLAGGSISTHTPTATAPTLVADYEVLTMGDNNSAVKKLQENLIKLGYKLPKWGADGSFGEETLDAVIQFQEDNKLEVDGKVGPLTQAAINTKLKKIDTGGGAAELPVELYRVRLSWEDAASQIGAYAVLANAIAAAQKAGPKYKVYNSRGVAVFTDDSDGDDEVKPIDITPITPITPIDIKPIEYLDVMVGSASKDENGKYINGQAGDQTGKEVYILNWYNGSWKYVLRPKTTGLGEKIATACEQGCNNNKIGYDQGQRNTLLAQAKKVGFDLSKITTPCECDCSSFVSTCCVCAGLDESTFFPGGNGCTTNNLLDQCKKSNNFTIFNSSEYLNSKDYLKRGDILLASGHTVIVLKNGSKLPINIPYDETEEPVDSSYLVMVNTAKLNVRKGPGKSYAIVTQVKRGEVYTIVEEKGSWGKLKSGAGWISLTYTKKV